MLSLSFVLGFKFPSKYLIYFIGLFPGIAGVLIFMRWPSLGIIVAIVGGMVVPFSGPSGLSVTQMVVALLIGLWLLDMLVRKQEIRLVSAQITWPLLTFIFVACLSFGVGQLPWFTFAKHAPLGAQIAGLSIFVLSAGALLLVANQISDLRWLKWMTWVFLILSAMFAVGQIITPLRPLSRMLFQSVGSMFWLWVVALAFSQAVFNRDLRPRWRLGLFGLVLATLYLLAVLKFKDKSGWAPVFVCIGIIITLRSWRAGLALVLLGALPASYLITDALAEDSYSVATRFDAALILIEIIKTNPILGLGFANYYWYTPLFPIRGFAVQFNSHNNYVDIVAQTGFVGLACLLWFYWQIGWLGWRLRARVSDGFAQAYIYGALGGLVGMVVLGMLGDWVLPFFYNIGLTGFRSSALGWIFLGGLVSLERITR